MKKLLILLILFTCFTNVSAYEEDEDYYSENIYVIDINNDQVLLDINSNDKIYPASLTKVMTTIIVLESINLDDNITITSDDLEGLYEANASVVGLRVNDKVTALDLVYGVMLSSGADAANALERVISTDDKSFIDKMNNKAKQLGMNNTNFVNTSGLHDDNHYSTLKDLSILMEYALSNDKFKEIITTKNYTFTDLNNSNTYELNSTIFSRLESINIDDSLLLGGKTGFTGQAGLCLMSFTDNYIIITTNADYLINDNANVIDSNNIANTFNEEYEYVNIYKKDEIIKSIDVYNSLDANTLDIIATQDIDVLVPKNYDKDLLEVDYIGTNKIEDSLKINSFLGDTVVKYNNDEILRISHFSNIDIEYSNVAVILQFIINNKYIFTLLFVIIFSWFIFTNRKNKRR